MSITLHMTHEASEGCGSGGGLWEGELLTICYRLEAGALSTPCSLQLVITGMIKVNILRLGVYWRIGGEKVSDVSRFSLVIRHQTGLWLVTYPGVLWHMRGCPQCTLVTYHDTQVHYLPLTHDLDWCILLTKHFWCKHFTIIHWFPLRRHLGTLLSGDYNSS